MIKCGGVVRTITTKGGILMHFIQEKPTFHGTWKANLSKELINHLIDKENETPFFLKAPFGTQKVLNKENSEEKWKEKPNMRESFFLAFFTFP